MKIRPITKQDRQSVLEVINCRDFSRLGNNLMVYYKYFKLEGA